MIFLFSLHATTTFRRFWLSDRKVLTNPSARRLQRNSFGITWSIFSFKRPSKRYEPCAADLGGPFWYLHLSRAFVETVRAQFIPMRSDKASDSNYQNHTKYYNQSDKRTAKGIFFLLWRFFTRQRSGHTLSFAAVFFEASRRAAVFFSGTRYVARSPTVTATTVDVVPEAISMARAFSTLGNSQKPPQKNDRKHKDRNSGHSGDSLWQSAIPWWLLHSNPKHMKITHSWS